MNKLSHLQGGVLVAISIAVVACQKAPSQPSHSRSDSILSTEVQRCAHGGVQASEDPRCRRVRDENFDRFMGKEPS